MNKDSTKLKDGPEMDLGNEAGSRAMEQALQSSFTILKLVIAVLVVYLIFSNTFSVDEDSEGAILLRFGQARTTSAEDVYKAGIRFAWPFPIDEKVEIARERPVKSVAAWHAPIGRLEVGDNVNQRPVDAMYDGYAITMDDKIIHVKAEMTYRVSEPSRFTFDFADATTILQLVLDNGLTYSAAEANLSAILENPTAFTETVKRRVDKLVRSYDLGVEVLRVNISGKDVKLPFMTQDAYDRFNGMDAQVGEAISSAQSAADAIRRAIVLNSREEGSIRNEAKNQAKILQASVESLANRFKDIVQKYPDPVSRRHYMEQLYYETMKRITENKDIKIWLVSKTGKLSPTKLRLKINQPPPELEEQE